MSWADFDFIPEELRYPAVEGFTSVVIEDLRRLPNRHGFEIRWSAIRVKDEMVLQGCQFVSAHSVMEARHMKDYVRALIDNIRRTIYSYANCDCTVWYDPHNTRKLYILDCEAHADKGHPSHPRDGRATCGASQAP